VTVDVAGRAVPRFSRRAIAAFTQRVVRAARAKGDLSIAFVDDDVMKDKTTDVLTFPADAPLLGEIVISIDQAKRQAADEKHSLATEVRYLLVHGVLHAMGYDHETDDGEMNALELRVRGRVGLE